MAWNGIRWGQQRKKIESGKLGNAHCMENGKGETTIVKKIEVEFLRSCEEM